jgi:para-nitrobenzyl esterase
VPTEVLLEQAEAAGRRLARLGGVEPTRAGFSALTEQGVLELQAQVVTVGQNSGNPIADFAVTLGDGLTLGPVVDGELVPLSTADAVRAGIGADKALLLGTADNEFNLALVGAQDALAAEPAVAVLALLGAAPDTAAAYVAAHAGLGTAQMAGQYVTDRMFRAPALDLAEARASNGTPAWLYRFAWRSPVLGSASHCLDIPFFFDCLAGEHVDALAGANPPATLAADVHGAAVAFIASGDPGWPAYEAESRLVRVYDTPSSVAADGYADLRVLFAGSHR